MCSFRQKLPQKAIMVKKKKVASAGWILTDGISWFFHPRFLKIFQCRLKPDFLRTFSSKLQRERNNTVEEGVDVEYKSLKNAQNSEESLMLHCEKAIRLDSGKGKVGFSFSGLHARFLPQSNDTLVRLTGDSKPLC